MIGVTARDLAEAGVPKLTEVVPFEPKFTVAKPFDPKNSRAVQLKKYPQSVMDRKRRRVERPDEHAKVFQCDTCDKCFESRRRRAMHMRANHLASVHLGLYRCSYCQMSYSSEENLKKHEKEQGHTAEVCDDCGLRYRAYQQHNCRPAKLYYCTICSKNLSNNSSLRRHNRTNAHLLNVEGLQKASAMRARLNMDPFVPDILPYS